MKSASTLAFDDYVYAKLHSRGSISGAEDEFQILVSFGAEGADSNIGYEINESGTSLVPHERDSIWARLLPLLNRALSQYYGRKCKFAVFTFVKESASSNQHAGLSILYNSTIESYNEKLRNKESSLWRYFHSEYTPSKLFIEHPNQVCIEYDLDSPDCIVAGAPKLEERALSGLKETLQDLIDITNGDRAGVIHFVPSTFDGRARTGLLLLCSKNCGENEEQDKRTAFFISRSWGLVIERQLFSLKLRISATSSAIGAIMARNGSHNIGSHVLSALSHNVGTMPDDRVLYQYIQHRMDYIASATTGAPDWSVPTPFVGNLMKMFYSQRHLLDHIAESDGLHAYQYQGKGTQIGDGQKNCVKIIVRRISHSEGDLVGEVKQKEVLKTKKAWMYQFFRDGEDNQVEWGNDEAVSVPGGILGQHAFYNIVENILRNAAKHSWAGKSKEEREKAKNLEIYVDFEKNQPDGTMWFTVGDNMSKLFPGQFWDEFFAEKPDLQSAFANPLDGFEVPPDDENSNRGKLEEFLKGRTSSQELPSQYKVLYDYVLQHWTDLINDDSFKSALQGVPDKKENGNPDDSKPGHRLPLPLHHRQEKSLAEPFINLETNRLRQSAWGLSEMKISAGYLRRAEVPVIGGLKQPQPGAHPLIVPLGIPLGKAEDDKEANWEDLCLAYRFWVKLPKDVLIVADNPTQWERFKQWEGIGVESYGKVFGVGDSQREEKGDIGLMSDYGFVIVDHAGEIKPDDLLKLPFRALRIAQSDEEMSGFPCVLRDKFEKAETRQKLVECVYRVWLEYLKQRRAVKDEDLKDPDKKNLTIKLHIYDEKGGEKGLISDRDIYKVLFRECLHSVLEPITVNYQIGDFDAWQRKALLLVSMYPLNENDDLFAAVKEKEGNHGFRIEGLLVKIVQKVRRFWMSLPCSQEMKCDKNQHLLGVYRESLNRSMNSSARPFAIELLKGLDVVQDKAGNGVNSRLCQALDDLAKTPPETTILGEAVKALDVARTTSDVFLRKYEERISTLPSQYSQCKRMEQPKKPKLDFGAFGVDVICDDRGTVADISYNRHATDGAPLYSEPLSGSQTYLNALSNMSDDDSQWAMRLAENGLVRIAIIDERVRAFIAEHGDDITKTYASMHIAVVDTEKKPDFNQEKAALPDLTKLPFVVRNASDADFDLVVIHQGIIDKWWPNKHGQKEVSDILSSIRKSGENEHGRFVVVTTGRGRPDNIPETAKVLAFSSIEAFLFKRYPEKLNLVNSLMSILPGSPERNDDHD